MLIGAAGAMLGVIKAGASYFFALGVGIGVGGLLTNSFLRVVLGANMVLIVFCGLALVGALATGRGRFRPGAVCFLVSAAGVLAAALLYIFLFSAIMSPIKEVDPSTPTSPNALFYWTWLPPVPLLLIAGALSLYCYGRGTPTSPV